MIPFLLGSMISFSQNGYFERHSQNDRNFDNFCTF